MKFTAIAAWPVGTPMADILPLILRARQEAALKLLAEVPDHKGLKIKAKETTERNSTDSAIMDFRIDLEVVR